MPSWNIHTAHVQELLASVSPLRLGIADTNAFLFGNIVPDIYVGYLVKPITKKIKYRDTHLADPDYVPTPDAATFYERFVRGLGPGVLRDLTLGAWTHLLCDHYYNLYTNDYIDSIGVEPGTQTRIRKQADFDTFGLTLNISTEVRETEELVRAAADFEQYAIEAEDVRAAVAAQNAVVRRNQREHVNDLPTYDLFTPEFFRKTYDKTEAIMREAMLLQASGEDPTHLGRLNHDTGS